MANEETTGRSGRLLVVDDDEDIRLWLDMEAGRQGWEVETAASGADALRTCEGDGEYDAFVIDQMMPGMSGLELVRKLRGDGYDQPMILFSAHLGPAMREEIAELGLAVVSKLDHAALFRVLRAAASR